MNEFLILLKGLLNNVLVTFLIVLLPLIIGSVLAIFQGKFKIIRAIFSWLSIFSECLCPVLVVLTYVDVFLYETGLYKVNVFAFKMDDIITPFWIMVLALSACFVGYMPARYVESYSIFKNIAYNGLGLISTAFKWSFLGSLIGFVDLAKAAINLRNRTYSGWYILIALIIAVSILFVIELGRRAVKQFLK